MIRRNLGGVSVQVLDCRGAAPPSGHAASPSVKACSVVRPWVRYPREGPSRVVGLQPGVEILLEFSQAPIELRPERHLEELVAHRPVEPLTEPIRVWGVHLGVPMIDLLDSAALLLVEGRRPVIEDVPAVM